jgi:hypothetical protein
MFGRNVEGLLLFMLFVVLPVAEHQKYQRTWNYHGTAIQKAPSYRLYAGLALLRCTLCFLITTHLFMSGHGLMEVGGSGGRAVFVLSSMLLQSC